MNKTDRSHMGVDVLKAKIAVCLAAVLLGIVALLLCIYVVVPALLSMFIKAL